MATQCDPCLCPEQHYRDFETWRKAIITLLCRLYTLLETWAAEWGSSYLANFGATVPTLWSSIVAGYTNVTTILSNIREITLDNQTNGDVWVSMDGGTTNTMHMKGGDKRIYNLTSMDLTMLSSTSIALKQGTAPPSSGTFYINQVGGV